MMPILTQRVILTVFLLLFSGASEAGEKKLIFNPPGSFLGGPAMTQIDYLSGLLDALYFVEKNGPPGPVVTNCLFEDENTTRTLTVLLLTAEDAVRKAEKRGDKDFSVVDALVLELKKICPNRGSPLASTQFVAAQNVLCQKISSQAPLQKISVDALGGRVTLSIIARKMPSPPPP